MSIYVRFVKKVREINLKYDGLSRDIRVSIMLAILIPFFSFWNLADYFKGTTVGTIMIFITVIYLIGIILFRIVIPRMSPPVSKEDNNGFTLLELIIMICILFFFIIITVSTCRQIYDATEPISKTPQQRMIENLVRRAEEKKNGPNCIDGYLHTKDGKIVTKPHWANLTRQIPVRCDK